jgi:hypothetical protein
MASLTHTKAESMENSSSAITEVDQSDIENLLREIAPYLNTSRLRGFTNFHPSPGRVSENHNISTSEVAEKTGNISTNTDKKLISPEYTDTVSDGKAVQNTVEYNHNCNSHCPSSPTKFQSTENFCVITMEMLNDEDRSNDIQKTDLGHSSGDVQALTRNENNIQMAWNAEINTNGNRSDTTQKVSNNTKENHAGINTETINSSKEFLNVPTGSATDILEEQYKTVQSRPHNSIETDVTAPKVTPPKNSLQCLNSPAMHPVTNFPSENMLLTLSTPNEKNGSFAELETEITSTLSVTSEHISVMESVDEDCNVARVPATSLAKNVSKEQESKSTIPKIKFSSMKTKKSKQRSDAVIYSGLLTKDISNVHIKIKKSPKHVNVPSRLQHVNRFSLIDSPMVPRSYPTGSIKTLSPLTPSVKEDNSMEKHFPAAIRKQLFSPSKHRCIKPQPKKYTPTILLETNENQMESDAESCKRMSPVKVVGTPMKICNKINCKTVVIPRNTDASISTPSADTVPDIRNESVTRTKSTQASILETALGKPQLDTVKRSMTLTADLSASLLTPSQNPSAGTSILTTTTTSVSNSCVPMKMSMPPIYSTALTGPLMTSAISHGTNPSVAYNSISKCLSPNRAKPNSIILPEVPCCSYENNTDTSYNTSKAATKLTKDLKYHCVPHNTFSNTLTETSHLEKTSQKTRNCLWPTSNALNPVLSSTETFPSRTAGELHQPTDTNNEMNILNSIQADGAEYAERKPGRVCYRCRGRRPVQTYRITANSGNRQSTRAGSGMQKSQYSDSYIVDAISHRHGNSGRGRGSRIRGSRVCRSNIRNSSVAEECKGTKRKNTKLKIKRDDKKNDRKIKKKRAYTRRKIGQDLSNNNKSPMTMCSEYTDQCCSKESPKRLFTHKAQHIPYSIIQDKFENYSSSKNHQESRRRSGQQTPTSEESRKTFISASPHKQITTHIKSNYEPISNRQQYCPSENNSYPIITDGSDQHSFSYNMSTENSTAVASRSFINNEQQMKRESEYSTPLVIQYQQNFIHTSDSIHNTYPAYHQQESASQMQYNDQYFPSFQNNNREQCTDTYEHADMWSDILRVNRDQEFPLEKVGRHTDQQNAYSETSTIQNGYQNLMNETEANSYAHQLEENRQNNEYLQQSVDYHHMSAPCSTYNYCRMNEPKSTQSFVGCQLSPEITNVGEIQYYQPSMDIKNLDESQYYLPSSRATNIEDDQHTMFTRNENIYNEQIINNQEYTNVLPMFQEKEERQKLDFYRNHNNKAVQETYVNDEESIAYNSEKQTTSGYPHDSIQLPVHSNSLTRCDGKFLRPHSQFLENFRLKEVAEMSVYCRNMELELSGKEYAGNQRRSRGGSEQYQGRIKPDKPYVCPICGKNEQYKVLLKRHIELQHTHQKK